MVCWEDKVCISFFITYHLPVVSMKLAHSHSLVSGACQCHVQAYANEPPCQGWISAHAALYLKIECVHTLIAVLVCTYLRSSHKFR